VLPCHRVQFWQTENSWRLDRSYRGRRRRIIPHMVDAARFRSLIDEFPSPSRTPCSQSPAYQLSWPSEDCPSLCRSARWLAQCQPLLPRARAQSEPSDGLHPSHAIESPDAQSGKTQSRKSEGFALDALSPLWTRDRAVGTAPRRLRASPVPPVQTGIHSGQVERLTDKVIPVDLGITGLASVTAVDLASHPP
jgi:hypothetical protein